MKMLAHNILGFADPMLVQTMYIFKSPKIGGEVNPHQDSTYIISNPLSCRAMWVALDDATQENGCMWGIPGSHKTTPIEEETTDSEPYQQHGPHSSMRQ
mgnify:CR=1 FL=1